MRHRFFIPDFRRTQVGKTRNLWTDAIKITRVLYSYANRVNITVFNEDEKALADLRHRYGLIQLQ